jgi:hypothetical protein
MHGAQALEQQDSQASGVDRRRNSSDPDSGNNRQPDAGSRSASSELVCLLLVREL